MSKIFSETITENELDFIQTEIQDELYEAWVDNNLDEGQEYAEYRFFAYASDFIKQQYNEFYGYTPNDEFYLEIGK